MLTTRDGVRKTTRVPLVSQLNLGLNESGGGKFATTRVDGNSI